MSGFKTILVTAVIAVSCSMIALAQSYPGQVQGTLSGAIHKYSGEFTDDLWGPGGFLSIQYAPISRLQIEARFGLGEIRWKVTPSDLAAYPEYFGSGAEFGDPYPGTLTSIEPENESRLTTIDLMVNYVLVNNIAAVPFISAGVGWTSFAPSNDTEHDALPNFGSGVYSGSAVSFPIGGGVKIPFSDRVGLLLRGEYRFVLSEYLDDVNFLGTNDNVTSVSIGLTYSFTEPRKHHRRHKSKKHCEGCDDDVYSQQLRRLDGSQKKSAQREPADELGQSRGNVQPNTNGTSDGAGSGPGRGDDGQKGAGTEPADESTDDGSGWREADSIDDNETFDDQSSDGGESTSDIQPINSEPCPVGFARVCVSENESVCVDTTFKPGTDRIRWENAFVYDPADPAHERVVADVGADSPCYSNVVRQTSSAFYQCVDCCFEKVYLGGKTAYVVIQTGKIVKGTGIFSPEACIDCEQMVARGK